MIHDIEEKEEKNRGGLFIVRQILNIIFILGAVTGAVLYWVLPDETTGVLVIMTSVFFKSAECILRLRR